MARVKVDEITNLAESGSVAFPTGGASFSGNVSVTGSLTADSVSASIALKNYATAALRAASDATLATGASCATVAIF